MVTLLYRLFYNFPYKLMLNFPTLLSIHATRYRIQGSPRGMLIANTLASGFTGQISNFYLFIYLLTKILTNFLETKIICKIMDFFIHDE